MNLLINDATTFDGTVEALPPFPALKFRYRPALAEDVYDYLQGRQDTGKKRLSATVALLAKYMASWDVADDQDAPVPITPASLARVPQLYLDRLLDFVTGHAGDRPGAGVNN